MTIDSVANKERRQILSLLGKNGEMTPTLLSPHFKFTNAALSRHLNNLLENNLISRRRDQNTLYYSINDKGLQKMLQEMNNTLGDRFEFNIKKKENSAMGEEQNKIQESNSDV